MKRLSFLMLAGCLLLPAFNRKGESLPIDDLMRKQMDVPLKTATTNDFLMEWARAGDVNFLADATEFPQNPQPVSIKQQGPLGNLIIFFSKERKLSHLRFDDRTFLFWSKPDDAALGDLERLVLAAAAKPKTELDEEPLGDQETRALLRSYFRAAHGWDGVSKNVDIEVGLDALPPPLRNAVLSEAWAQLMPDLSREPFLRDEFWEAARLQIRMEQEKADGPRVPRLFVDGPSDKSGARSATDVGRLNALTETATAKE